MKRQKLINRLRYLRNFEFINIFFLPGCLYFILSTVGTVHWMYYIVSMFVICFILAQGVLYWHLKLQSVRRDERALPSYSYQIFRLFRWVNVLLLAVYPALFFVDRSSTDIDFGASIWSHLIYIFSILEYVNYYHYQLSHDSMNDIRYLMRHRKIRRSPLWKDMQQTKGQLDD